jgi:hypothetical protein
MMKNFLTSVVLFTLFSGAAIAQSIYVRGGTGYGLPTATSSIGQNLLRTVSDIGASTVNTYSTEGVIGSYGAGINFNIALGYKFNENFIFELNTQYLISNKYKTSDNYSYTGLSYSYVDNDNISTSAKGIFFNPSFIFSAGFGKAAPYGRFGLVAGKPKVSGKELIYYNGDGIDSSEVNWEYTKGIAFGFQGAIGMNWKLTEKLDFYTEMNFISMTYYAGEYNLTKSISTDFNGVPNNDLPNMSLSQKQIIFKKKFDPSTVNSDFNQPHIALRESIPFSSVSLQAGLRFVLWKKAE